MKRNTIQRTLVLEAVNRLRFHPTAEEIYDDVIREHPHISKATVYRNLNQLAEDREIQSWQWLMAQTVLIIDYSVTITPNVRDVVAFSMLIWIIWMISYVWSRTRMALR